MLYAVKQSGRNVNLTKMAIILISNWLCGIAVAIYTVVTTTY